MMVNITIDLESDVLATLQQIALDNGVDLDTVVEVAVRKRLLRESKSPAPEIDCTVDWLQNHLDKTVYEVAEGVAIYKIYTTETASEPSCVLVAASSILPL